MPTKCYSRKDFLSEYDFPLQPARDLELDGQPAVYAVANPRQWGGEHGVIDFGQDMVKNENDSYGSYHCALSFDQRLLAVSSNQDRILVYDVTLKELRAVLEGAGHLAFRPVQTSTGGYNLISSVSYDGSRGATKDQLILWDLDQNGRLIDQEEPLDTGAFASKAIEAILPELVSDHEWTREFVERSSLHKDIEKSLERIAADHRRRHFTAIPNASVGHFASNTFSGDGSLLLYHAQNSSTQSGMREADQLPRVVVFDIEAGKILHQLTGHTDAIMWSSTSPDHQHVASVSWDGTLRMYSLETGHFEWASEDSGGQSWSGAFTPDSKHIVWSSKSGRVIKVHAVMDGQEVATLQEPLDDWCRQFTWHPAGDRVAFCVGKHAYVWYPFEGPNGTVAQHFILEDNNRSFRRMIEVQAVTWMDSGRLLALQFSEGSKLVYDTVINHKELFQRPKGIASAWTSNAFFGTLKDEVDRDFYLSVDGDNKVRFWLRNVPSFPSWWEKEPEHEEATTKPKKLFPETGKYVKITKVPSKETS